MKRNVSFFDKHVLLILVEHIRLCVHIDDTYT